MEPNTRSGFIIMRVLTILLLTSMSFVMMSCGISLSKEQIDSINTLIEGRIQAEWIDEETSDLWNENLSKQLSNAVDEWQKKYDQAYKKTAATDYVLSGLLSELQMWSGEDYHDKYWNLIEKLQDKASDIEDEFIALQKKMSESLMNDFYSTKQHINELFDVYEGRKEFDSLGEWTGDAEFNLFTTPFMLNQASYSTDSYGLSSCEKAGEINLESVYVKCLDLNSMTVECTQYYGYLLMYHYFVNRPCPAKLVYIVEVEDAKDSFVFGYDNRTAYLCSLSADREQVAIEEVVFDQTLIGEGM